MERPMELTHEQERLFLDRNFGAVGTSMADGSPHVTILWVDYRDGLIWLNTATPRQKPANLARDARIAVTVWDASDPYRWVQVRGAVVESTREGADDHIRWLNRKYNGDDDFQFTPGEQRLILKIRPDRVVSDL
jgi:PPOX class probable F420-dependent enzyme